MSDIPQQATPEKELRRQIMSCMEPKNEREHWAARHIEQLEKDKVEWISLACEEDVNEEDLYYVYDVLDKLNLGLMSLCDGELSNDAATIIIYDEDFNPFRYKVIPHIWPEPPEE